MNRILFLCGSPKGEKSSSYSAARYLSKFLDYDYKFIDVAAAGLTENASEAEPQFLTIVEEMNKAAGMVESALQKFIGRTGSMLVMPCLKEKYGFVVATGGGLMGKNSAGILDKILRRYGVSSIAALTDGDNDGSNFAGTVKWTVQNLDRAMEEKWKIADRCTAISEHYFMREIAAKYGFVFRALYKHYRKHKLFDFPPLLRTSILWPLLKSEKLVTKLITFMEKDTIKKERKRFERFLQMHPIGKGREVRWLQSD